MTTKQTILLGLSLGVIITPFDIYFHLYSSILLLSIALISSGVLFAQLEENKKLFKQNADLNKLLTPLQDKIIRLEKELSHYTNQAISQAVLSPKEYNTLYEMNQKNKSKQKKQQNQD